MQHYYRLSLYFCHMMVLPRTKSIKPELIWGKIPEMTRMKNECIFSQVSFDDLGQMTFQIIIAFFFCQICLDQWILCSAKLKSLPSKRCITIFFFNLIIPYNLLFSHVYGKSFVQMFKVQANHWSHKRSYALWYVMEQLME